jgi:hypothetical protein
MVIAQASNGIQNCWSKTPGRRQLLDHQGEGERGQHVQMLVQTLENRPHGQNLGDDPEQGAGGKGEKEARRHWHTQPVDEQRTEHAPEYADGACGEAEHARGGEHDILRIRSTNSTVHGGSSPVVL